MAVTVDLLDLTLRATMVRPDISFVAEKEHLGTIRTAYVRFTVAWAGARGHGLTCAADATAQPAGRSRRGATSAWSSANVRSARGAWPVTCSTVGVTGAAWPAFTF